MAYRTRGRITKFDYAKACGLIRSSKFYDPIPFSASDISYHRGENYAYGTFPIDVGAKVSFIVEEIDGRLYARDVRFNVMRSNIAALELLESIETVESAGQRSGISDKANDESRGSSAAANSKLVALGIFENKIKLVTITADGKYRYVDPNENLHTIVYLGLTEVFSLQYAIEEFEYLINKSNLRENEIQEFFNRFPEFILNDDYKQAHSHVVLTRNDGELLIPDFVLEPVIPGALCDLLELKLPGSDLFVLKKNRPRFSAAVFEAASQLREYNRYFDDEKNRSTFHRRYPNLNLYKPRMFVLIGRLGDVNSNIRRDIEMDLPQLTLKTYDEILARMKWKLERRKGSI